jgi:WD40 repeat protein
MMRLGRRLAAAFCLAVMALVAAAAPVRAQQPNDPPPQPFLRVEAAAHTATVPRLAVDAAGRLLATASVDKTLRLWSLPEGAPRGVLRPPIGPEEEGELYAVALSPDGSRAFTGGFTARSWDGAGFAIYLDRGQCSSQTA